MKKKTNKTDNGRYMNLLVDFAFKKVFGENKTLLIDFLNVVIQKEKKIETIEYLQPEQMTKWKEDRRAVFDIYCKTQDERFIIELQIAPQHHFMERLLFYLTFPIQSGIKKGAKTFEMKPLYCVAILDFPFFEDTTWFNHISLIREETRKKVTDKLHIILIELPKFDKQLAELETKFDQWLYCFKHLKTMNKRPVELTDRIFDELFEIAEKNNLTIEEMATYKKSVLEYDDVRSAMLFNHDMGLKKGREEGMREGMREGRKETILQIANALDMPVKDLAKLIGYNKEQ
jgi:predicted transposase/invertase (TIGR01784 family)